MTKRAEFHPLANIFPLMEGAAFEELKADIRENGLHDEIVMHEGKILDGRNRYRALCALVDEGCELAPGLSLDPETSYVYVQFETDVAVFGDRDLDPLSYVISKNLKRRHLDESQRAMVAARLANMRQGERNDLAGAGDAASDQVEKVSTPPADAADDDRAQAWAMREAMAAEGGDADPPAPEPSANLPKVDQATAAAMLNVSERSLRSAKAVQATGAPELQQAVDAGQVAVSTAAAVAELPAEEQREVVARGEKEILRKAKEIRQQRQAAKRDVRLAKLAEISRGNSALPTGRKWPVIVADPEWRFTAWSEQNGMDRLAENHYPTSSTDEIAARDVKSIAADHAVLFLWAIGPMLPDALRVMEAWGFAYKSHTIWDKGRIGLGYWTRYRHELLLLGTRGDIPAPLPGQQWESVIQDTPPGPHSAKPEIFLEMIEAYFPGLPKIELNRRGPARPGWDAWGNQVSEVGVQGSDAPQVAPSAATSTEVDPPVPAIDLKDIPSFLDRRRRADGAAVPA